MSDFKAKMHQIQIRLGLRPKPAVELIGGAYTGRGGEGKRGEGKEEEGREVEGRGWTTPPDFELAMGLYCDSVPGGATDRFIAQQLV